jgi:hypothetical protein
LFFLIQYNIKKKEELPEPVQEEPANPLMRKKKTPEELAKEAEMEEEDEFTSKINAISILYFYSLLDANNKRTLNKYTCVGVCIIILCTRIENPEAQ